MRKLLPGILIMFLSFGVSFISPAEEDIITQSSQANSSSITVGYNAGVTYTVTIPASVTFTDTEKRVERSLQVTDVVLSEGSTLHVNLASLNDFKMICGDGYIEYHLLVNANDVPEDNYTILTVSAGDRSGWAVLDFVTDLNRDHTLYAGNYTDLLTFTVAVE